MSYHLEGRLLEVCNCNVLCPCWIGEDPDNGTCDTIVAWRIDKGTVDGVDVGGNTIAAVAHVPGQHPAGQLDRGDLRRRPRLARRRKRRCSRSTPARPAVRSPTSPS